MSPRSQSVALVLPLLFAGCGDAVESGTSRNVDAGATWALSAEPILQIGVVEGASTQQFSRVMGTTRLADGRIVVLDGDSRELRFFSSQGTHIRSVGGNGEGPGQFRSPNRLWRGAQDTLRVFDARTDRMSVVASDGSFIRTEEWRSGAGAGAPNPSDPFLLDEWVIGWNWIDSPLRSEERGGVQQALASLPPADTAGPMRPIRVTPDGLLWTHSSAAGADAPTQWSIYHPEGTLLGTLELPGSFTAHDIGGDYVLGVFRDRLGVEFVRLYTLDRVGAAAAAPGLAALRSAGPAVYPAIPEEAAQEMRASLRNMASRQEIYYSNHYTYASRMDSLAVPTEQLPADVRTELVSGDERGWAAVFLHRPSGATCVMAMGAAAPPGWPGGRVICPGG